MTNITCVNSVTTVQENSNLPKTYFNIKGKFHTKDTTFYIYLDSDVLEVSLSQLQVSGVNPVSMQAGITALATLLANAGAGGGGGGNSALPINDLAIDLYSSPFTASNYGIYRITGSGDGTNDFAFPDPTAFSGKTLIIHNMDTNIAYFGATDAPYDPADTQFYQISALSIVTCVSYNGKWYSVSSNVA